MDAYGYLAAFLILFFLFIYLVWFGFSVKIENCFQNFSKSRRKSSKVVECRQKSSKIVRRVRRLSTSSGVGGDLY